MMEKRNRNGGRGREQLDDDLDVAEEEPSALRAPEAPARKPSEAPETARPRGTALTRIVLILLAMAAAALLYRYWGFWQGGPTAPAEALAPVVTVSKPLVNEMQEWSD